MSVAGEAKETKLKYGYVPLTFPRDPVQINQFAEHIVLGQIVEPIVNTDQFGNVVPGLAESWKFENDGLTIKIKLSSSRKFSNGKAVTANDAKYTLDRTLKSKAQSSNFLTSILSVEVPDSQTLVLRLREPNVSILKALSRDQLGVVPDGWAFDPNSSEPIVGTGHYRMVKEGSKWLLVANSFNPDHSLMQVKTWELVYYEDPEFHINKSVVPDYIPAASFAVKKAIESVGSNLKSVEQISFAQTSAWWHPSGDHYGDSEAKQRVMAYLEEVMAEETKRLSLKRATGVIPEGVAGHIKESKSGTSNSPSKKPIAIKVSVVGGLFDSLIESKILNKLAEKHGLSVQVARIHPSDMPKISSHKTDVILASWAGGFNDPEGFIALLPTFLGQDFMTYIGADLAKLYKQAREAQDWSKRSDLFRSLNASLRETKLMVPGWKVPLYIIAKENLLSESSTFRYTPRLQMVRLDGGK